MANSSYLASKRCDVEISEHRATELLHFSDAKCYCGSTVSAYGKSVINLSITIFLSIPDQIRGGIGSCTCFLEGTRHKACCTPWQVSSFLNLFKFYNAADYWCLSNSGTFSKSEFTEMMEEHKHNGNCLTVCEPIVHWIIKLHNIVENTATFTWNKTCF